MGEEQLEAIEPRAVSGRQAHLRRREVGIARGPSPVGCAEEHNRAVIGIRIDVSDGRSLDETVHVAAGPSQLKAEPFQVGGYWSHDLMVPGGCDDFAPRAGRRRDRTVGRLVRSSDG